MQQCVCSDAQHLRVTNKSVPKKFHSGLVMRAPTVRQESHAPRHGRAYVCWGAWAQFQKHSLKIMVKQREGLPSQAKLLLRAESNLQRPWGYLPPLQCIPPPPGVLDNCRQEIEVQIRGRRECAEVGWDTWGLQPCICVSHSDDASPEQSEEPKAGTAYRQPSKIPTPRRSSLTTPCRLATTATLSM